MITKNVIVVDIVGLEKEHLDKGLTPNITSLAEKGGSVKMKPAFPAVTCTVQASILSGKHPNQHGIISNGMYDRETHTVSFWEQPSSLVRTDRVWDSLNGKRPQIVDSDSVNSAVLFWQNTMYANSEIIVTPRPLHMGDGSMVMWCYSKPVGYYEELTKKLGEFNLGTYWGPFASHKSSEWICSAAEITLELARPKIMFVYLPHIDYSAQKYGSKSIQVREDLKKADEMVGRLLEKTSKLGINEETEFLILSEYPFNDVSGDVPINRKLRDEGLLNTRIIGGKEYIDYEFSPAFAMVDHQVAHVYVKDGHLNETCRVIEDTKGVDRTLSEKERKELKIDHPRSGEIIALSDRDRWFSYYWWNDTDKAPPFAGTVDIHRKPGYDPLELFYDIEKKSISTDTSLIKGSHGRPADLETGEGLAVCVANRKLDLIKNSQNGIMNCVDIAEHLVRTTRG